MKQFTSVDLLIIGAGPAGLRAAQEAEEAGLQYVVLESGEVGQAWRNVRPDMRMLSPCLPQRDWTSIHYKFPIWKMETGRPYCTAAEFATYLQAFAEHFKLNILTKISVQSVQFDDGNYLVFTDKGPHFTTRNLMTAVGVFGSPHIPAIPGVEENPYVLHSNDYEGAAAYKNERVLIIGAGNSAAEIAIDLAGKAMVYLVSRGELVFFSETQKLQNIRGISESYLKELIKMEIVRYYSYQDVMEIKGKNVYLKNRMIEADKIIFATGYRPCLKIMDSLQLRSNKYAAPETTMTGESIQYPGLFFVGPLAFQTPSGAVIHGFLKQISVTIQRIQERIQNQPDSALSYKKKNVI